MVASSKKQKQKTIAAKPIVPGAQLEDGGRKAVRTRRAHRRLPLSLCVVMVTAPWVSHFFLSNLCSSHIHRCITRAPAAPHTSDSSGGKKRWYVSGSVIHKTPQDTYILTQRRMVQSDTIFIVNFYDKSVKPAKVMLYDEKFTILSSYSTCYTINFCDPIDLSNALVLIPMDPYESKSLNF